MRRVRRFREISKTERLLLLRSLFIVAVARCLLWLVPVDSVQRAVLAMAWRNAEPISRTTWAVRIASQFVPKATCLTQALAAQALLVQAGHHAQIEIGVAKDEKGFEAHAWVACGNEIVIGGPDVTRYERLTTWKQIPLLARRGQGEVPEASSEEAYT